MRDGAASERGCFAELFYFPPLPLCLIYYTHTHTMVRKWKQTPPSDPLKQWRWWTVETPAGSWSLCFSQWSSDCLARTSSLAARESE